jgi:hypothetical protein
MTEVNFEFLAKQNARILEEMRSMRQEMRTVRDELRVNSAMVQRCSNAVSDQVETLNAIHQWMIGINERLRKPEGPNGQ